MTEKLVFVTGSENCSSAKVRAAAPYLSLSGYEISEFYSETFPDGEVYHKLTSSPAGKHCLLLGNFSSADSAMELFDLASLLAENGALSLKIVTPEGNKLRGKKQSSKELIPAEVQDMFLHAVPQTPYANEHLWQDTRHPDVTYRAPFTKRRSSGRATVSNNGVSLASESPFVQSTPGLLLASKSYGYMQKRLSRLANFELAEVTRDDKTGAVISLQSPVRGRNVVIVSGTIDHAETVDLLALAMQAVRNGALSLTVVLCYFGYSTMERAKPQAMEAVKASYRARLLSAIPKCPLGNRFVLVDLHSEGIPYYFAKDVRTSHCYAIKEILLNRLVRGIENGRLASTDAGRSKWVESITKDIGRGWLPCFAFKDRKDGSITELLGVMGDVFEQNIWLFDDMIRTGGSAIKAASGYRAKGCASIDFVAGHGVLPGRMTVEKLRAACDHNNKPLFSRVVVSDSHPHAVYMQEYLIGRQAREFLYVEPMAEYLLAHLSQVTSNLAIVPANTN